MLRNELMLNTRHVDVKVKWEGGAPPEHVRIALFGDNMTYIPDLEEREWWHGINFAYSKSIPENFNAIMVGWLGSKIPSTGKVSAETIKKIEWARDNRTIDQGCLGEHECEICNNHRDRGEILIIDGEKIYVAPRMILHYIIEHFYRPPEEFLNAVNKIDVT